jgi:hypothetical protein
MLSEAIVCAINLCASLQYSARWDVLLVHSAMTLWLFTNGTLASLGAAHAAISAAIAFALSCALCVARGRLGSLLPSQLYDFRVDALSRVARKTLLLAAILFTSAYRHATPAPPSRSTLVVDRLLMLPSLLSVLFVAHWCDSQCSHEQRIACVSHRDASIHVYYALGCATLVLCDVLRVMTSWRERANLLVVIGVFVFTRMHLITALLAALRGKRRRGAFRGSKNANKTE